MTFDLVDAVGLFISLASGAIGKFWKLFGALLLTTGATGAAGELMLLVLYTSGVHGLSSSVLLVVALLSGGIGTFFLLRKPSSQKCRQKRGAFW